ncbi:TraE/TraK family type IV conjugative transfer system protein [Pseudaeromonas pectinilytica]
MKFDVFLKSWQGTQLENRWQRFLIAVLVLSNLLLAVAAFSRNTVVAIQPPTLSETAEVSRNQATQPYLESWGLYLAELMGNVTPGNVSFIRVAIEPLAYSHAWRSLNNIHADHVITSMPITQ